MKRLAIFLFLSLSARAESFCASDLRNDVNSGLIAYFQILLNENIFSVHELSAIIHGKLVNARSTAKQIHLRELRAYLGASEVQLAAIVTWLAQESVLRGEADAERSGEQKSTESVFTAPRFFPIPPGKVGKITLTHPIEVMQTLVTQKMYEQLMGTNPSKVQKDREYPVESLTWFEAAEFANRLSERNKYWPVYNLDKGTFNAADGDIYRAKGYRLPTFAEALYLNSALGTSRAGIWPGIDENNLNQYAWTVSNAESKTKEVATLLALSLNGHDFFDLIGNLSIWIHDVGDMGERALRRGRDPVFPNRENGNQAATCGAHFNMHLSTIKYDVCMARTRDIRSLYVGMRLVRTVR